MPHYWAAYRMGVFDLAGELEQPAFREQIEGLARTKPVYTLLSVKPVGMVTLDFWNDYAWPSVIWFPWATPRQKLETAVFALRECRRDLSMMFFSDEPRMFIQMKRYGLMFQAGELHDKRKIYERRKW
jgi:hypothetical protein